jgi:gamma-carbonic anhydrase
LPCLTFHRIGSFSSIGDNCVVHTAASLPTGMSAKVHIGANVTIGSGCTLYSCHIEDDVYIGDKCVILEGARIEKGAMLAPGSVVPPGRLIPAKQLWAGNPVEYVKDLDIGEVWANYTYSYVNTALGDYHKNEFTQWQTNYLLKPSTQEDLDPNENDLEA